MRINCGGFHCFKHALIALNILYIVGGLLLSAVGFYVRYSVIAVRLPSVTGTTLCGFTLIFLSIIGLAGAIRHQQLFLFFYMIILGTLCVTQLTLAVKSFRVSSEQQEEIITKNWIDASDVTRQKIQWGLVCCAFDTTYYTFDNVGNEPTCHDFIHRMCCYERNSVDCSCCRCKYKLLKMFNFFVKFDATLGIIVGIFELLGVYVTIRYRNQKNPRFNSSEFL